MIGVLRVKNEARWIERCLRSILPVCERVLVMDDHSTDDTFAICEALPNVYVFRSPFTDLNETRDKNYLLEECRKAEWLLMIDGDEVLTPASALALQSAALSDSTAISLRVLYLWDQEDQIRVDGVYGRFRRPSMFRPGTHRFESTGANGNFHCGNVPLRLQMVARPWDANLLHFGYLHKEDRIRKYNWYRQIDGANPNEDGYKHMVIGDLFPAESKFQHAGPLQLESL